MWPWPYTLNRAVLSQLLILEYCCQFLCWVFKHRISLEPEDPPNPESSFLTVSLQEGPHFAPYPRMKADLVQFVGRTDDSEAAREHILTNT